MYFKILFCLFASSLAAPPIQQYGLPSSGGEGGFIGGSSGGGGFIGGSSGGGGFIGGSSGGGGFIGGSNGGIRTTNTGSSFGGSVDSTAGGGFSSPCGNSQALNADGSCGEVQVTRNIFVFQSPEQPSSRQNNPPPTPKPKLNYNIVFVRTPEGQEGYEPVVVPPAQQKTIVYVLSKDEEDTGPKIIQVPDIQPHAPEVFYINYEEGDNPQLPIGIDLQTALANAVSEQGQLLAGGGGAIGGGSNFGAISGGSNFGSISGGSNFGSISGGSNFGAISSGSNFGGISGGSGIGISSGGLGGVAAGGSIGFVSGGNSGFQNGNGGFINNGGNNGLYSPPNPPSPPNLYSLPQNG